MMLMWKIETKNYIFNARNSEEHTTKYVYSGGRLTSNCLNERFVWCMHTDLCVYSVCSFGCAYGSKMCDDQIDKRFVNNSPFEWFIVYTAVLSVQCTLYIRITDSWYPMQNSYCCLHWTVCNICLLVHLIILQPTKGQQSKGKHMNFSGFVAFHTCCRINDVCYIQGLCAKRWIGEIGTVNVSPFSVRLQWNEHKSVLTSQSNSI